MQQLTVKLRLRDKHAAELNRQARAVNRVCKIGAGSFNQDARGRWYINLPIELERASETPNKRIGIDLGLKALATPRSSQLASHLGSSPRHSHDGLSVWTLRLTFAAGGGLLRWSIP